MRQIHYGKNAGIRELIERQFQRKLEIESKRHVNITTLFFHADGRPIKNFRGAWNTACEKSGIYRTFHDLRRTAVRNLIRSGVSQKVAMEISGHTTDSVFNRYDITSPADREEAASKVGLRVQNRVQRTRIDCTTY